MLKRSLVLLAAILTGLSVGSIAHAQGGQFPLLDMLANRVVQKYQQSSCSQLAAQRNQPPGPEEQRAIRLLHEDSQMRQEFINRVAAPIANKLFECGLIP